MELKKNPKVDLRNKSTLFLQLGLILVLLITWGAIEYKTVEREYAEREDDLVIVEEEEDIPITKMVFRKPPPPPPPPPSIEIIEVIKDEEPEKETVFEETDVEEEEDIPEEVPDFSEVDEGIGEEEIGDVPFAIIQEVPTFPGCEKERGKAAKKACMEKKIQKYVLRKFNTDLGSELGLSGIQRIFCQFKISKTGTIVDVQARAPHPRLQKEAIRVVSSLPKMKPGMQRNKPVGVLYSLPITFRVDD